MGDWPIAGDDFRGVTITSYDSVLSVGGPLSSCSINQSGGTNTWPSANQAFFVPIVVPRSLTVVKMFWVNGAAVSGNVDTGIYDVAGNRLVSIGTTAQAGTSAIQIVDTTDLALAPGRYYLALACDNTTATFARSGTPGATMIRAAGCYQMATAFVLPDPVTFAASTSATTVPLFGASMVTAI